LQTFEAIAGNQEVIRFLETALERGEISHSYLFYGPSGVGKRTVALHFGAALAAGEDEAARERALRGLHPDLLEIEPEGQFTTIGQVRGVIGRASEKPFEGVRRVFVLHVDSLNLQSSNALLKTLEEPEGRAVFILLATSRESVLPTILSRSQALRFNPVPVPAVEKILEERGFEGPRLAASLGRGSVGLSLRYAGGELDGVREEVFSAGLDPGCDAEKRRGVVEEIISRAEKLGEEREKGSLEEFEEPDRRAKEEAKRDGRAARDGVLGEALGLLALLYRDAAVVASGASDLVVNTDRIEEIEQVVKEHPEAGWIEAAARAEQSREDLARNLSPEAVLEMVLLEARRGVLGGSRVR
jgi:DNA polymerase-3 subunit delta'